MQKVNGYDIVRFHTGTCVSCYSCLHSSFLDKCDASVMSQVELEKENAPLSRCVSPVPLSVPCVLENPKDDQIASLGSLGPGGCDLHLWEIHPKDWKEDTPDSVQRSVPTVCTSNAA